jgi:uncharacterized ion transporter superfamily protein YfcC
MFAIVINLIAGEKLEKGFKDISDGASQMLGVCLVIAFSRGISVIMEGTQDSVSITMDYISNKDVTIAVDQMNKMKDAFGQEYYDQLIQITN